MADQSIDTIPVADLLELVRKHAADAGWCEDVEDYLRKLGLEFKPAAQCDCPTCMKYETRTNLSPRFTPVDGAPTTVARAAVIELIADVRQRNFYSDAEILDEAEDLFGLKASVAR